MAKRPVKPKKTKAKSDSKSFTDIARKLFKVPKSEKAKARQFREIFSFPRTDRDRLEHTQAMNRLAEEMRLQRKPPEGDEWPT